MTTVQHHHAHALLRRLTEVAPRRFQHDPRWHAYYVDGQLLPTADLRNDGSWARQRLEAAITAEATARGWRLHAEARDDGQHVAHLDTGDGRRETVAGPAAWLAMGAALARAVKAGDRP